MADIVRDGGLSKVDALEPQPGLLIIASCSAESATLATIRESLTTFLFDIWRLHMEKVARLFVLLALTLALGGYVVHTASSQEHPASGKKSVTGCLQKGDDPGEYSITGEDGKTYGLRSKSVDLSQHLGHKVTVTGTLGAESAETEKGEAEEHEKKEAAEAGDIRVTDLKMVSDKCQ